MRRRVLALALLALVPAGAAHADDVTDGDHALARHAYRAAIAAYKRAAAAPAALCGIGRAYAGAGALAQAFLFLDRCVAAGTATADDRRALAEVVAALEVGKFAPVEVATEPSGAEIAIASFASDERATGPTELWLPYGTHTLTIRAAGHVAQTVTLTIDSPSRVTLPITLAAAASATAGTVDFGTEDSGPILTTPDLHPKPHPSLLPARYQGEPAAGPPLVDPEADRVAPHPRSPWPWVSLSLGAVGLAGGIGFHLAALAAADARDHSPAGAAHDAASDRFATRRTLAVVGYAVGALATGVGLYLVLRPPARGRAAVALGATPAAGGGWVWLELVR